MKSLWVQALLGYALGLVFVLLVSLYFKQDSFLFAVLDVGQGNGIYIRSETGFEVIIDGGAYTKLLASLSKVRSPIDNHIDILILSHPDSDHMGAFPELIRRYNIKGFISNIETATSGLYHAVINALEEKGVQRHTAVSKVLVHQEEGFSVQVIYPDSPNLHKDRNDNSLVVRVDHGGVSYLIPGDISSDIEEYLLEKYPKQVDVDVLVAGHHGSNSSTSEKFLTATSPAFVVLSSGKDNRYGHPHQNVLDRIKEYGAEPLRTNVMGSILFTMGERGVIIQTKK